MIYFLTFFSIKIDIISKFSIYIIKQKIFFVFYFVLVPFPRTCIHNLLAYGLQETSRLKAAYRLRTK